MTMYKVSYRNNDNIKVTYLVEEEDTWGADMSVYGQNDISFDNPALGKSIEVCEATGDDIAQYEECTAWYEDLDEADPGWPNCMRGTIERLPKDLLRQITKRHIT